MTVLSLKDLFQAMSMLPQITDSIKNMNPQEKTSFVEQLGVEGEEREAAFNLITAFQEGRQLTAEEQRAAQHMLDKALNMQELNIFSILNLGQKE